MDLETLLTVPGAAAAVALILFILRGIFAEYWNALWNRIAALVFSVGLEVVICMRMGGQNWDYMDAVLVALVVCLAVIKGGDTLIERIEAHAQAGK